MSKLTQSDYGCCSTSYRTENFAVAYQWHMVVTQTFLHTHRDQGSNSQVPLSSSVSNNRSEVIGLARNVLRSHSLSAYVLVPVTIPVHMMFLFLFL